MKCEHCEARLDEPFTYRDAHYCCECMSALTSWLLDGGFITDIDLFPGAITPETRDAVDLLRDPPATPETTP